MALAGPLAARAGRAATLAGAALVLAGPSALVTLLPNRAVRGNPDGDLAEPVKNVHQPDMPTPGRSW